MFCLCWRKTRLIKRRKFFGCFKSSTSRGAFEKCSMPLAVKILFFSNKKKEAEWDGKYSHSSSHARYSAETDGTKKPNRKQHKISPQNDFIVIVVLIEEFYKVVGKHAGFACRCYRTMPPATRLHFNIRYHGAFHKVNLVQFAGRVVELHYCTD